MPGLCEENCPDINPSEGHGSPPSEPSGLPAGGKSNRCQLWLDLLLPSPGNHHRGKNSSTCQEKRKELCSLPSHEQGLVTHSFRWPSPRGTHASVSEKPSGGPAQEGLTPRYLKSLLGAPEEKEAESYKEIRPFRKCGQLKLKTRLHPAV